MDDAALQLPDDPAALKRVISRERAAHAAALARHEAVLAERDRSVLTLREDNALLQHRLNLLLRASYGPRAERFDPRQLLLFGLRVPPIEPVPRPDGTPQAPTDDRPRAP